MKYEVNGIARFVDAFKCLGKCGGCNELVPLICGIWPDVCQMVLFCPKCTRMNLCYIKKTALQTATDEELKLLAAYTASEAALKHIAKAKAAEKK